MPKTDEASRSQAIIEIFRRKAAGSVVEIDQNVAAEDNIEIAVSRHVARIDKVDLGELNRFTQTYVDAECVLGHGLEIACDDFARKPHEGATAVNAIRGRLEHARI